MTETPQRPRHLRAWAVLAAVVVLGGMIAGALAGGGSPGKDKQTFGGVAPAAPIDVAGGRRVLATFADSYTREKLPALEALFASGFTETVSGRSCNGRSPLDEPGALAELQCEWEKLGHPAMRLSAPRVDLALRKATAAFTLVANGTRVGRGTIELHLVPGSQAPLVDQIALVLR